MARASGAGSPLHVLRRELAAVGPAVRAEGCYRHFPPAVGVDAERPVQPPPGDLDTLPGQRRAAVVLEATGTVPGRVSAACPPAPPISVCGQGWSRPATPAAWDNGIDQRVESGVKRPARRIRPSAEPAGTGRPLVDEDQAGHLAPQRRTGAALDRCPTDRCQSPVSVSRDCAEHLSIYHINAPELVRTRAPSGLRAARPGASGAYQHRAAHSGTGNLQLPADRQGLLLG